MSKTKPQRRWFAFFVYAAISIGLLIYVIRSADWTQLDLDVQWGVVAITVVLSLGAYLVLPTLRWQWILRAMGYRHGFSSLLFARMGSQPLKFAIPLRGGEAFRAVYLNKRHGVPNTHGLGSVLFDLSLVAASQLSLLCIGLVFYPDAVVSLWLPLLILLLLCVGVSSNTLQQGFLRLIGRLSKGLQEKAEGLAHPFLTVSMSAKWSLYLFSVVVEAVEIGVMALCFWSFGIDVSLVTICTVMPVVVFISLLPVTIGGFGTRELAMVTLFASFAHSATLTSIAFLFSTIEVIVPALLGCLLLPSFLAHLNADTAEEKQTSEESTVSATPS